MTKDCECCGLPLSRVHTVGVGDYCLDCMDHWYATGGNHDPNKDAEAIAQRIDRDHRQMWDAFMGVLS